MSMVNLGGAKAYRVAPYAIVIYKHNLSFMTEEAKVFDEYIRYEPDELGKSMDVNEDADVRFITPEAAIDTLKSQNFSYYVYTYIKYTDKYGIKNYQASPQVYLIWHGEDAYAEYLNPKEDDIKLHNYLVNKRMYYEYDEKLG